MPIADEWGISGTESGHLTPQGQPDFTGEQGLSSGVLYEPWVFKMLICDALLRTIRCLVATMSNPAECQLLAGHCLLPGCLDVCVCLFVFGGEDNRIGCHSDWGMILVFSFQGPVMHSRHLPQMAITAYPI